METYWLLGPTQAYLTLTKVTSKRTVTISDLNTDNKKEPLAIISNDATSTILKGIEATLEHGTYINPTSLMTQKNSSTKDYALNKSKEQQLICPFGGTQLI